jgi:hypothetical protein
MREGKPELERASRRLFFAIWLLLGLAFAAVCYGEMLGVFQFD